MKKLGAHPGFLGYLIINADGIPIRRCVHARARICLVILGCVRVPATRHTRHASASRCGPWPASRKQSLTRSSCSPPPALSTTRRQCSMQGLSASCAPRHALPCGNLTPRMISPFSVFDHTSTRSLSPQVSVFPQKNQEQAVTSIMMQSHEWRERVCGVLRAAYLTMNQTALYCASACACLCVYVCMCMPACVFVSE